VFTLQDAVPPLGLLGAASLLTFAQYRVAPLTWRISNNLYRYGALALSCALSLAYVAAFSSRSAPAFAEGADSVIGMASVGLLGLAAGFLITALALLIPRRDE
jgi:hypothetical protein